MTEEPQKTKFNPFHCGGYSLKLEVVNGMKKVYCPRCGKLLYEEPEDVETEEPLDIDEPTEEDIKGIAEILPNSSPEEVTRIARSIHQRHKQINEELNKLQEIKLETWNNELKERKEAQQRTMDSREYLPLSQDVDKIITKLTSESVYGYYDCLHIYYSHGEKGAREILEAGKENMVTADDLIVISDFMADDRLNDLPMKRAKLNIEFAGVNRVSKSKEKKLPRKLRKGW